MIKSDVKSKLYGVVAEFETPDQLLVAARKTREAGYSDMDAYSPIPVHGLYEVMGGERTILPWFTLGGALLGGIGGYMLQYWVSVIEYPLNVGGRPFHSWPSFIPVTFECTILGAALATVIGLFAIYKFPQPYHSIFNAPGFKRASDDRYFLCIEATDPKFDADGAKQFMESLDPVSVSEVEP